MNVNNVIAIDTNQAPNVSVRSYQEDRWFVSKGGFFCLPRAMRGDIGLSNLEFRVLVVLASYVYTQDFATPSLKTLSEQTGISESAVSKATKKLEEEGWIVKTKRPYQSVYYQLTLPPQYARDYKEQPKQQILI